MSNVYKRNQSETGLEYYDNATTLYVELRKVLFNTNVFPKRTMYTDVVPMMQKYHEMRGYIVKAEKRFPNTQDNLDKRREYIQCALQCVAELNTMVQDAILGIDSVTPERMEQVGRCLMTEYKVLRNWKRNSKILQNKKQ